MTEIPSRENQLDRIEGKVDQLLQRMTRLEERQNNHGASIESHSVRLNEHAMRLREIELSHAVSMAGNQQTTTALNGRWLALGAAGLTVLSALGAIIGRVLFP